MYCVTSGCSPIRPSDLLVPSPPIDMTWTAWFVPEDLVPYISGVVDHGPVG
jgi:hypothetical protein